MASNGKVCAQLRKSGSSSDKPPTTSLPGNTPFCVPGPPPAPFSPCNPYPLPCNPCPPCPPQCPPCAPCPPACNPCPSPCNPCPPSCYPCVPPCNPCLPPCNPCSTLCPPCPPGCFTLPCPPSCSPFVPCDTPCGPSCCPSPNLPTCSPNNPPLCCPVQSPPVIPPCPKIVPPPSNAFKMFMMAIKSAVLIGAIIWTYNEGVWSCTHTTDRTYRRWVGKLFGIPKELPCSCNDVERLPTHSEINNKISDKINKTVDNTMKKLDPWVRKANLPGCNQQCPEVKEEPIDTKPVEKDLGCPTCA